MPGPPITLPIAQYAPDQPGAPIGQTAQNVHNVYPRSSTSYGPMPAPTPVMAPINNQSQGFASFIDATGTTHVFAGDVSRLYHVSGAGATFTFHDVSTAGGYNVNTGEFWEFVHFNGQVLATEYNDPIQAFTLGAGGLFFPIAAAAPKAKHMAVVKNSFVMVGNTQDASNGQKEQRVWWCAAGDASNWPIPGSQAAATFQAGAIDLLGDTGPVNALRSDLTSADGLVFQQASLRRIVYVGPPAIFDFLPAQNARGTYSPYAPVVDGGICYFPAFDGFFSCDGASVTPIGSDRINRTFLDDVIDIRTVQGARDPIRQVIWWSYAGQGAINGVHNRILGYSWLFDRWCLLDVTAETIGNVFAFGYTLDQLGTILGYTLDNLPAPLDSPLWQGGSQILGVFDSSHKLNFFTGPAMAALVDTQEMEIFPGQRALITGVRPLVDGNNAQIPQVAIKHREITENSPPTVTPYLPINALGKAPLRTSGRYIRASISIPAGGDWTNISGAAVDAVQQGQR